MERQRIDKWLWHARVVRTRQAAAELAGSGHVRLNGQRIEAASRAVRPGDVVTVALDHSVRVLKVVGFAERRGSAEDAKAICEIIAPAAPPAAAPPAVVPAAAAPTPARRVSGSGRPTKQERRALERFTRGGDS